MVAGEFVFQEIFEIEVLVAIEAVKDAEGNFSWFLDAHGIIMCSISQDARYLDLYERRV